MINGTRTQPMRAILGRLTVVGVFTLLLIVLLITISKGIGAMRAGNLPLATHYVSFASGTSTVLLLGITAWYAYETRRMAGQTEKRLRREQERREREILNLRRSIKHEIRMLPDYDQLVSIEMPDAQHTRKVAPTTVFERNAQQIGKLGEHEVKFVLQYYHQVSEFNDFLEAFRRGEARTRADTIADSLVTAKQNAIKALDAQLPEDNTTNEEGS